ncbi:unnamed protein product, partial [Owenia fusiformis]
QPHQYSPHNLPPRGLNRQTRGLHMPPPGSQFDPQGLNRHPSTFPTPSDGLTRHPPMQHRGPNMGSYPPRMTPHQHQFPGAGVPHSGRFQQRPPYRGSLHPLPQTRMIHSDMRQTAPKMQKSNGERTKHHAHAPSEVQGVLGQQEVLQRPSGLKGKTRQRGGGPSRKAQQSATQRRKKSASSIIHPVPMPRFDLMALAKEINSDIIPKDDLIEVVKRFQWTSNLQMSPTTHNLFSDVIEQQSSRKLSTSQQNSAFKFSPIRLIDTLEGMYCLKDNIFFKIPDDVAVRWRVLAINEKAKTLEGDNSDQMRLQLNPELRSLDHQKKAVLDGNQGGSLKTITQAPIIDKAQSVNLVSPDYMYSGNSQPLNNGNITQNKNRRTSLEDMFIESPTVNASLTPQFFPMNPTQNSHEISQSQTQSEASSKTYQSVGSKDHMPKLRNLLMLKASDKTTSSDVLSPTMRAITITPMLPPPSRANVTEGLGAYHIPEMRYIEPFASDSADLPNRPMEVGGRLLKVPSLLVHELKDFDSSHFQNDGIKNWRTIIALDLASDNDQISSSFNIVDEVLNNKELKRGILTNKPIIIAPCMIPPKFDKVKRWHDDTTKKILDNIKSKEAKREKLNPDAKDTCMEDKKSKESISLAKQSQDESFENETNKSYIEEEIQDENTEACQEKTLDNLDESYNFIPNTPKISKSSVSQFPAMRTIKRTKSRDSKGSEDSDNQDILSPSPDNTKRIKWDSTLRTPMLRPRSITMETPSDSKDPITPVSILRKRSTSTETPSEGRKSPDSLQSR